MNLFFHFFVIKQQSLVVYFSLTFQKNKLYKQQSIHMSVLVEMVEILPARLLLYSFSFV